MTVEELFKSVPHGRLDSSDRWMVYDFYTKSWEVYTHKKYARNPICLIKTDEIDEALEMFINYNISK